MRLVVFLLALLFVFSVALFGCGEDQHSAVLELELEEAAVSEDVVAADAVATEEFVVADDDDGATGLYGTVPVGTTAIDVFEFTDQKDIVFLELIRNPDGIGDQWLTDRIVRATGFPINIIEQVITEAKAEMDIVVAYFSGKEGPDRYTRFVEAEREIVQGNSDALLDLPEKMNTLFEGEFGISFEFAHNILLRIHLEENPHDAPKVLGTLYGYSDLVFIYGLGQELFPEMSEEEALKRFRMLARADRTNLIPH